MISHQDWRDAGFRYILPILPLVGELSPNSKLTDSVRGKTPAIKGMYGWHGFDWLHADPSEQKLAAWTRQGAGIGIQGRDTAAIDIDVTSEATAHSIKAIAHVYLGHAPVRVGNPPKCLLPYRWAGEPGTKRKLKFRIGEATHAVELLGYGQQWVADGIHPKTGEPYAWDVHPTLLGRDALPEIDADRLDEFFEALESFLIDLGAETKLSDPSEGAPIQHTLRAPSTAALRAIVDLIPNDDSTDYDDWCRVAYAIRASAPDDPDAGADIWRQFSERSQGTPEEPAITEKTWEGTRDGPWKVGYGYLCDLARETADRATTDTEQGRNDAGAEVVIASFEYDEPAGAQDPLHRPDGTDRLESLDDPFATEAERPWGFAPWVLTPYFEPAAIPERQWTLGSRFMGKAVTAGFGPPGVAKSMFAILSAIAIASNVALTGEVVHASGPVWVHNNEEDLSELQRRIAGICNHFDLDFNDLDGRLHVSSGYDHKRLILAQKKSDVVIAHPDVERIIEYVREHNIHHLVIDPFVSTHMGIPENANEEIERVLFHYRRIAVDCGCSIDLIHHTVKTHSGDSERHAGDQNAGRGASSIMGAVRVAYTLAAMSEKTRDKLRIPVEQGARLVRLDRAKGNYSPREAGARWFELMTVPVIRRPRDTDPKFNSGDTVGVPTPFSIPTVTEGSEFDDVSEPDDMVQTVRLAVEAWHANSMAPLSVYALAKAMHERGGAGSLSTYQRRLKDQLPVGEPSPRYLASSAIISSQAFQLWIEQDETGRDIVHGRPVDFDLLN